MKPRYFVLFSLCLIHNRNAFRMRLNSAFIFSPKVGSEAGSPLSSLGRRDSPQPVASDVLWAGVSKSPRDHRAFSLPAPWLPPHRRRCRLQYNRPSNARIVASSPAWGAPCNLYPGPSNAAVHQRDVSQRRMFVQQCFRIVRSWSDLTRFRRACQEYLPTWSHWNRRV